MSQEAKDSRELVIKLQRVNTAGWKVVESTSSKMAPRKGSKNPELEEETTKAVAGGGAGMASGPDPEELPIAEQKGQRSKRKKAEAAVGERGAGGPGKESGRKKRKTKAELEAEAGGVEPGAEAGAGKRKGKGKIEEESGDESETSALAIDAPTPKKDPSKPLMSKRESQKVLVNLKSNSKTKTLTERMNALIPPDIKRDAPNGVIEVPLGLLSVDDHVINGKRVAFNPRQVDEGGVEAIAVRIRQNGYDAEHFMPTGIFRVSTYICGYFAFHK